MKRFNGSGHFGSGAGRSGDNADFGLPPSVGGISLSPSPVLDVLLPELNLPMVITQLTTSWGGTSEGTTRTWTDTPTIYYSIPTGPGATSPNDFGRWEAAGFNGAMMTTYKHDMAAQAFELWDDLIAVNLTETTATSGHIITMAYSSTTTIDAGAHETYAYPVVSGTGTDRSITAQRIWLASSWVGLDGDSEIQYGTYGFNAYVHEIGHSLGLSHPGTYDSTGGITYAADAEYATDTRQHTVMSYFGGWTDSSGGGDTAGDGIWTFINDGDRPWNSATGVAIDLYPATPMVDDIAAIQAKYGADMTTRTGDTTYGFHSTAGRDVYDFTIDTRPILSIWDAGGNDTLDASGFSQNQVIDLAPGAYSSIGELLGNVGIAYNCTIENAVGGSGNDILYGNTANNTLTGGGGDDRIYGFGGADLVNGGAGNDVLFGGAGQDTLNGGAGKDCFVYQAPTDSPVAITTRDVIADFELGDRIDVSAIDANPTLAGNQAFAFVTDFGGSLLDPHPGELQWDRIDKTHFLVSGDVNGDGIADFAIQVNMPGALLSSSLHATDFLL